jgi:hypothetical protein
MDIHKDRAENNMNCEEEKKGRLYESEGWVLRVSKFL